jgi:hypothetical protein
VALEAEFWAVIDASAARDRLSLAALVAKIDATRGDRPLASALRLFALAAKGAFFAMITLYHAPRSRSSRFIFLLEELGAPYEIDGSPIRRGDGSGGVDRPIPIPMASAGIRDGETLVYESAAIALYLTDKFPQNGIGPWWAMPSAAPISPGWPIMPG